MKKTVSLVALLFLATAGFAQKAKTGKWISLFDGKSLAGWKVGENASSFKVEDGAIVVNGPRGHLFYEGEINGHDFKNFEYKAQVMTFPSANSGMYIHTKYQEKGWPSKGYEIQVNNSHTDWRRTGSVYGVQDLKDVFVNDNEWYTEHIIVEGKRIRVKINDKTVIDYTEPEEVGQKITEGRKISNGTFALQAHDPKSKVMYKDIMVKILPD